MVVSIILLGSVRVCKLLSTSRKRQSTILFLERARLVKGKDDARKAPKGFSPAFQVAKK
nr:MAG TPA: hypothetical protein [Caudoviricetes sp.]